MALINKQKFICLDCETTGLDTEKDSIIEVAAVSFDVEQIYEQYESLVDPKCEISAESIAIHHITQEMVQGKPFAKDILPKLLEFVGDHIIIGHGIEFDINMIANTAKKENIPCNIKKNQFIDTLRMARLYGESPINSLEYLRKHFHIDPEIAHRAMSDVIVNVEVFKKLAKQYKTTEELFKVLSRPILMRQMPLGKHKGRLFKEIPINYLRWAANKDFDNDLLYSIRSELKRRNSGGLFAQEGNPFLDL